MCGFYAQADSTKPIRIDLDKELVGEYVAVYLLIDYTHSDFRRPLVYPPRGQIGA